MLKEQAKRGVALFMVLATLLIIIVLANIALAIISSQARLTHHQVSRVRAYYAAQAALVYTTEKLRTGVWSPSPAAGAIKYACLNGCIDSLSNPLTIPSDTDIPFKVQVAIHPKDDPNRPVRLDSKVDYTYTP